MTNIVASSSGFSGDSEILKLRAALARVKAKSEERKFWLDSMVRLCWDQYEDMPTEIQDKIKKAVED